MAGDWIPIRCSLPDDPAVIAVAAATGTDECGVVGRLVKLWAWANQHTTDGNAPGVTENWLDRYVGAPGFAAALIAAGWLTRGESGVEFPKFDRWNSQSAKERALAGRRVAAARSRSNGNVTPGPLQDRNATATKPQPEKRREEKKKEEKTPLPPAEPGGGVCEPPTPDLKLTDGPDPEPEPEGSTKFADMVGEWVAARLPGCTSPGGIQRTPNRVGHWQARLRDPTWAARWREAVRRAGRSARCRGEDPKWPQGLRLDTFLSNPDLLVRLLEGEFDAATGAAPGGGKQTIGDVIAEARRKRNSGEAP